jgi:hypothetical protein
MKATDTPLYTAVCLELRCQAQRMNAANAMLDYVPKDGVEHDRVFKEFDDASFMTMLLSRTKTRMEMECMMQ